MGNWKALFVSVFSTLLLGCCLVPAFAEDAAITNQNGSSAIAMEQLNVPDDASGVHSALDDVSDSEGIGYDRCCDTRNARVRLRPRL